ncbi:MAG TPA: preprotein translocase subunit SecG [Candidatus Acidoferrales bacterium]|nr:preprotein translocase subunit SecG [Candidatus Acidoferrales bacterium]
MEVENPGTWALSLLIGACFVALGWRFHWVLVTLHVSICFLLCIVVLLQSGKAADLAGAFGGAGSQTAFGPRGAANFLSRATTWCAIMFMATSMTLVVRQGDIAGSFGSIFERMGNKPAPAETKPAVPGTQIPLQLPAPGQAVPGGAQQQQTPPATTTPPAQTPAQQQPPAQPPAKKP